MADFSDINAIPPLRPELLEKVRDPAAKAVLQEIVDAWKRVMRLGQVTRAAGMSGVADHDHDAATAGHGGILTADRHDSYSRWDVTTTTAAVADAVKIIAVDYTAGDTRLQVVSEAGTKIWLGNGAILGASGNFLVDVVGAGALGIGSSISSLVSIGNAAAGVDIYADNIVMIAGTGVWIGSGTSVTPLRFYEASGNGSNYVGLKSAAALGASLDYTLPDAVATSSGMVLTSTTGGVMSWDAAAVVLAAGSAATVTLGGGANPAILRYLEGSGGGTNYIGFKAAATMAASLDYTLPDAAPAANGYHLACTTAGVMSWSGSSAGLQSISLTNNFTNATNTLNATNLSFTVGATKTYRLTGRIKCGNSTITEGIQFDFGGGSCTATTFEAEIMATNGTLVLSGTTTSSLTTALSLTSSTNPDVLFINGFLLTNGGGTLILRFAENSAHATGTASLIAGTWLELVETTPL